MQWTVYTNALYLMIDLIIFSMFFLQCKKFFNCLVSSQILHTKNQIKVFQIWNKNNWLDDFLGKVISYVLN